MCEYNEDCPRRGSYQFDPLFLVLVAYTLIALWTACYFYQSHQRNNADEVNIVFASTWVGAGWPVYWTCQAMLYTTTWAIPREST